MTVQLSRKEFSSSNVETISGNNEMEVGPRLDNDLVTNASAATFLDSYYALHDKGDVMAGVIYNDGGSQSLRAKEIFDARSFYGATAFTVSGSYAGSYGEPIAGNSSNSFINRVNSWLQDQMIGLNSMITIKDLHFKIDASGQKRMLIIYDATQNTARRYYAKIYSQKSTQVALGIGDGPPAAFDADIAKIDLGASISVTEQFCAADVDPNGDRHILAIYSIATS